MTEQNRDNIDKATSFSDKMQQTKSAQFPTKERFLVCPFLPESMRKMALTSQTKFLESMCTKNSYPMGQKQNTEYIQNMEHEIETTILQNAKCENSNEVRYLRNEKD